MNSHTTGPAVGLISNPGSGHNRDQFAAIAAAIEACAAIDHRVTHAATDIFPALQAFAAQDIDYLAINGGDGTASAVLGCALEKKIFSKLPPVIVLPGGTANMNAGDIGVGGKMEQAVSKFCDWTRQACPATRTAQRPLLRVTTTGAAAIYSMFLGAGAIVQGTDYAHREIHSRGLRDDFSLALGTARTIWGVFRNDPRFKQAVPLQLQLDGGEVRRHRALILALSTLQRLTFGMRPFWGGGNGSIQLTLIEQDCSRFVRTFLSIIRGKPNGNARPESGYHSHRADRVELCMDGELNLDGEILTVRGQVMVEATDPVEFLLL